MDPFPEGNLILIVATQMQSGLHFNPNSILNNTSPETQGQKYINKRKLYGFLK